MAKKIIRLTESDLAKLVQRVIMEQEVDYEGITNEVKNTLMGKATYFIPNGSSAVAFKVNNVTMPENVMKPRIVIMDGETGQNSTDKFYPSSNPVAVSVEYKCVSSSDPETSGPITKKAKMYVVSGKIKGGDGILNPKMVDFIESKWCSKLPTPPKQEPFI